MKPSTCPWRPFTAPGDPYVARIINAHYWFELHQFEAVEPDASHRVVEGVAFYHRALKAVEFHQFKEAQARAAAEAKRTGRRR